MPGFQMEASMFGVSGRGWGCRWAPWGAALSLLGGVCGWLGFGAEFSHLLFAPLSLRTQRCVEPQGAKLPHLRSLA